MVLFWQSIIKPNVLRNSNPKSELVISAITNFQKNDLKLKMPISKLACPKYFIFSQLAKEINTRVGLGAAPFTAEVGIIEIRAPVATRNFIWIAPTFTLISNFGELHGTELVRPTSLPSDFQ